MRHRGIQCTIMAAVSALALLAGCMSKHPADPARATAALPAFDPIEWPTLPGPFPMFGAVDPMGLSNVVMMAYGLSDTTLVRYAIPMKARIAAARTDDHGVLLALELVRRPDWTTPAEQWRRPPIRRLQYLVPGAKLADAMRAVRMLGEDAKTVPDDAKEWQDAPTDGVTFELREPVIPEGQAIKGLIIWYHSLGGLSFEEPVLEELQRRGWLIAVAGFPWGVDGMMVLPLLDGDVAPQARLAAGMIDQRLAVGAYAGQAVRDYLYEKLPELKQRPLVLWGASAGSFCTPAAALRLGGSRASGGGVDAMVLVGSGANLLAVSQESTFFDGGIKVLAIREEGEKSTPQQLAKERTLRKAMVERFAGESKLDPGALAERLADLPMLMVHGKSDDIVPARLGDELWEKFGKPERWVFSSGHQAIFWRLSTYAVPLADWVERAVGEAGNRTGEEVRR